MKTKGISILEVLLALVVISMIITMSVRYFFISARNMKVTQTIAQIEKFTQFSYDWLGTQRQLDFSAASGQGISLQTLIDTDLVTDDARDTFNPWGGSINITAGTNPKHVRISFTQIPQKACRNLATRLSATSHIAKPRCAKKTNNTYTGEF